MPTANIKAETAARLLVDNIVLKFGAFRYLISDRSASWLHQLFAAFLTLSGFETHHIKIAPYRAQTSSLYKLQNKHIIRHLRAYCRSPLQFPQYLPAIAAAVNTTTNITLGVAPSFVLYGMNYRLRLRRH